MFRLPHRTVTAVLAVIVMTAAVGCGSAHKTQAAVGIDRAYLLQVQTSVLVDARGFALYVFAPDRDRAVTCTKLCAGSWPPLYVNSGSKAEAGPGVNAKLLGSDPDPAGGRVVTYGGWPLYRYAADVQPDIATGQAVNVNGGYWYLIRPDGTVVDPTADGTPPVATTT
jgi:predicted lipoprotein with Yx(FWY)xxD motif